MGTVIAIPNERLLQTVNLNTNIQDAFKMADDILVRPPRASPTSSPSRA